MNYLDARFRQISLERHRQYENASSSANERIQFTTAPGDARVSVPEFLNVWNTRLEEPAANPQTALDEHRLVADLHVFRHRLDVIYREIDTTGALPHVRKGLYGLRADLGELRVTTAFDTLADPVRYVLSPPHLSPPRPQDRASIKQMADYLVENAQKDGVCL